MMSIKTDIVKGWVKVLPFYLFTLLTLFASCKEEDDTVQEYADWQAKNEAYFEEQYQAHAVNSSRSFIIKKVSLPDTLSLSKASHTDCVLVDVLEEGDGGVSPLLTDTVEVHYRGWLIPSPSYPAGYQFDSSYTDVFDPDVAVPSSFAVNGVVEGFATALQHMHRGDYWRVTIPYQLGYGTADYSSLPAYSTLIFNIRLEDF